MNATHRLPGLCGDLRLDGYDIEPCLERKQDREESK